jgi:hypothetical protein
MRLGTYRNNVSCKENITMNTTKLSTVFASKVVKAFSAALVACLAVGDKTARISGPNMLAHSAFKNVAGVDLTEFPGALQELLDAATVKDGDTNPELIRITDKGKGSGYSLFGREVHKESSTKPDSLSTEQRDQVTDLIGKADYSKEVTLRAVLHPLLKKCETADQEDSLIVAVRSALKDGMFPGYGKEGNTKIVRVTAPVSPAVAA